MSKWLKSNFFPNLGTEDIRSEDIILLYVDGSQIQCWLQVRIELITENELYDVTNRNVKIGTYKTYMGKY